MNENECLILNLIGTTCANMEQFNQWMLVHRKSYLKRALKEGLDLFQTQKLFDGLMPYFCLIRKRCTGLTMQQYYSKVLVRTLQILPMACLSVEDFLEDLGT